MFIRPEINEKFTIEWTVISAPDFKANPKNDGVDNENFSIINFSKKIIIIGGTGYTGEIKKGIFSVLNFTLAVHKNILPMHCSANSGTDNDTSIFFGLSGTGKTTLSTDSSRKLIGDDEHGWDEKDNIFNFEGGCYAKVLNLSAEKEPEIYNAIKPGALLENVIIDKNGVVDFNDKSITQNAVIKSHAPNTTISVKLAKPIIAFSLMSFSSLNNAPNENFSCGLAAAVAILSSFLRSSISLILSCASSTFKTSSVYFSKSTCTLPFPSTSAIVLLLLCVSYTIYQDN